MGGDPRIELGHRPVMRLEPRVELGDLQPLVERPDQRLGRGIGISKRAVALGDRQPQFGAMDPRGDIGRIILDRMVEVRGPAGTARS